MDFERLLIKYIAHVLECEGISFIDDTGAHSDIVFTPEEWAALQERDMMARNHLYGPSHPLPAVPGETNQDMARSAANYTRRFGRAPGEEVTS